jgi:hypothetical protein
VPRSADITSIVSGACIAVLGVLLLLDARGTLDLEFAVLGPVLCAAVGAILLASGLSRPR